ELKLCSRNARRRPKSKFYGRTKSTIDCSTAAAPCVRDPRFAEDPHRRSDFERYEQNDCSKDGHARATSEVRENRQPDEKVLCARRGERGKNRRHGPHHGSSTAEQTKALAVGGSRPKITPK